MPSITILVGLPGSGKSTYAGCYEDDSVVISRDSYVEAIAKHEGISYNEAFLLVDSSVVNLDIHHRLRKAFSAGKNVIIDMPNMTVRSRRKWLEKAPTDYKTIALIFSVPEEELSLRLKTRGEETGKIIEQHVLDNFSAMYVEPSKDEGFDIIMYRGLGN